jgi:hypothetical protein
MKDAEILKAIGLSEADAADLVRKHQAFLASLNPAQYEVFRRSMRSPSAIAASISPNCTVEDLNRFVAERCPSVAGPHAFSVPCAVDDSD